MAGLPPFISLPGLPGLGLPLPKLGGGASKGNSFGELFDHKMDGTTEIGGMHAPSASLSQPFDGQMQGVGTSQAIASLGKPLGSFLDSVNALQLQADGMKQEFATGGNVELHDVMVAAEKASVGIELTMQIRNKMVDAYQEVMRMSV